MSSGISFRPGSNVLNLLGIEPTPVRAKGVVCCSFCEEPIPDLDRATFGTAKPRKLIGIELIRDKTGKVETYQDKVFHMSTKVVACPNCCLQVQPILNSKGEVVAGTGTKFRSDFD